MIGAPRSGTTLAYQLLVRNTDLGYLSNFQARLYFAPVTATLIQGLVPSPGEERTVRAAGYVSEYGRTPGWRGASEAGRVWYRWFPKDVTRVSERDVTQRQRRESRRTVQALSAVHGSDMVFKNVYHSQRIRLLSSIFPHSSFVVVHRTPLRNAESILRAREQAGEGRGTWWSLPPRSLEELRCRPWHEQIAGQVLGIYADIEEARADVGHERFLGIEYEEVCERPVKVLRRMVNHLRGLGGRCEVTRRPPPRFPRSTAPKVPAGDLARLEKALEEYGP